MIPLYHQGEVTCHNFEVGVWLYIFILFHFIFLERFLFYVFSFWLHWVFVATCRLSLVAVSGSYSSLRCVGFSLRWPLLLWSTGSRCVGFTSCGTRALELRLSSCGARAQLLRGMWDPPGPGLEPVSPALAGRFPTIVPPGKPGVCSFNYTATVLMKTFFPFGSQLRHVGSLLPHVGSFQLWRVVRDLVPSPGIEPGPPALGAQSLSHWTAREVPRL